VFDYIVVEFVEEIILISHHPEFPRFEKALKNFI
jgi:hypothetical protein